MLLHWSFLFDLVYVYRGERFSTAFEIGFLLLFQWLQSPCQVFLMSRIVHDSFNDVRFVMALRCTADSEIAVLSGCRGGRQDRGRWKDPQTNGALQPPWRAPLGRCCRWVGQRVRRERPDGNGRGEEAITAEKGAATPTMPKPEAGVENSFLAPSHKVPVATAPNH